MGFSSISQQELGTYYQYLGDIKRVERCYRKKEVARLEVWQGRIMKDSSAVFHESDDIEPLKHHLKGRVEGINTLHRRLPNGGELVPLALTFYNTHLTAMQAWNDSFPHLRIELPFSREVEIVYEESEDAKALERYFELLEAHPSLNRDDRRSLYQILHDHREIRNVQKRAFESQYKKLQDQGIEEKKAEEWALRWTRPGVVFEDKEYLMIRDAVVSLTGVRCLCDRLVFKRDLERNRDAHVAVLPTVTLNHEVKIALQLAFCHTTNSWEWEIPRRSSKRGESAAETAQRGLRERMGCTGEVEFLGAVTPDSEILASKVSIFKAGAAIEKTQHDLIEEVCETRLFTFEEIREGILKGGLQANIRENWVQIPLRDSLVMNALFLAYLKTST